MWQLWTDDEGASPQHSRSNDSSSVLQRFRSRRPSFALLPAAEDKRGVLYFTSLRIVRSTYDDCRAVGSILRDAVDERDVSMSGGFLTELRWLSGGHRGEIALPQMFVGGRYVGGAEEIRRLNGSGELRRIVDGAAPAGERCDGLRFVICGACCGSHKTYVEKGGDGGGGGRFLSCCACNENGLLRCPRCGAPSAVAV